MLILLKRFGCTSLFGVNTRLFGRFIGFVLNLLLIIYLLLAVFINLKYYVSNVSIWSFRTAPPSVIAALLLSPCVYAAYKGLKVVARVGYVVYITLFIFVFIVFYSLHYFKLTHLLPVFAKGIYPVIEGIPDTSFSYMGFETLLFIYPFIKDKQNTVKTSVIASAVTILLFAAVAIACYGAFGENMVGMRDSPFVGLSRLIKLPVLERMDLYFLAAWIPGMSVCINAYLFLGLHYTKEIFGLKSTKIPLSVLTALILLSGLITLDRDLLIEAGNFMGYTVYVIGGVVPLLWLIISLISGRKGEEGA